MVEARSGVASKIGDVDMKVTRAVHSDPDTVGFRFETSDVADVSYTSDTEFFEEVGEFYRGVRVLLPCLLRPSGKPWKGHMTTHDAIRIVQEMIQRWL